MFTGIVEEREIVAKDELPDAARFTVRGPVVTSDAGHGDSIAVNGVCLTVVEVLPDGGFTADVMQETLNRSSLAPGCRQSRQPRGTRRHSVAGSAGTSSKDTSTEPARQPDAARPRTGPSCASPCSTSVARYVVEKGSITVDGVSLTVSGLGRLLAGTGSRSR